MILPEKFNLKSLNPGALWEESNSPLIRWSLLVMGILAFWFWIVEPLQMWRDDLNSQVERNAGRAARLMALEQNADEWIQARNDAVVAAAQSRELLFDYSSDTQAQANMQNLLRDLAQTRGVTVESQKLIPAELAPPIGARLVIEFGLRGGIVGIMQLIDDIADADKLFVIERWSVQIDRNRSAFSRVRIAAYRPGPMEATDS